MVRIATILDVPAVTELAVLLWPHAAAEDLAAEFTEIVNSSDGAVFLFLADSLPAAFAHVSLRRDYVEGTDSSPVGYLEGIFVRAEFRRRGLACALLRQCEMWAKEKGCTEFASDCELDNESSIFFHGKLGFTEANRIVCFHKTL